MGLFFKSRKQKLIDIYQKYYKGDSPCEIEDIIREHPKLELYEAILISGFVEQSKSPKEFTEALKKLDIR